MDSEASGGSAPRNVTLTDAVVRTRMGTLPHPRDPLLKTPTAALGNLTGAQHPDHRKAGGHGPTLADEVEHLLPTPAASSPNAAEPSTSWQARQSTRTAQGLRTFTPPLGIVVQLLPTPMANEAAKASNQLSVAERAATGQVYLTNVVRDLELGPTPSGGAPTPTPSPAGSRSPAELHPTLDWTADSRPGSSSG